MRPGDTNDSHRAVLAVVNKARANRPAAEARLSAHGVSAESVARAAANLERNSRLTLNFHPDRRDSKGRTVAAGLLADGRYRSQFETGISNGGRFAVAGGDRMRWETTLFDGVYDKKPITRPVYGALDLFRDPYGGSPRFGSCFAILKAHCLDRVTLCVGDSHLGPVDIGTRQELMSIMAGSIDQCSTADGFGRGLSIAGLLDTLASDAGMGRSARELDRYIEAQIHGGIDLARDVQAVVLDPSFQHTDVEHDLETAAERHGFEVGWNEGSAVHPEEIPTGFRGTELASLARSTVRADGLVDAAAIGRALADVPFTPPSLTGDPEASPQQQYKKLWHCCLKYGSPQR